MAARTGGNAAENNALPLVLIIYGACEAIDGGIKLYNAYKLAEAIDNQDEEGIIKYGGEIVVDSTIGAVPLSGALTKLGMTKIGMMIAGIGAKVGDNVTNLVTKLGPDKAVDAIRNADDYAKFLGRVDNHSEICYTSWQEVGSAKKTRSTRRSVG